MPATTPQVALVTGGARGIGAATCRALAAQGAAIAINYTSRPDAAEALAAELRAQGTKAITLQADVADEQAVRAMVARTEAELGPLTILVNNAGIAWAATIDTWNPEGFARLRAVNVDGTIHAIRAVVSGMRARRYGRIVNVSSIASFGTCGFAGNHFYASTKAEVNILTKRFALGVGPGALAAEGLRGIFRAGKAAAPTRCRDIAASGQRRRRGKDPQARPARAPGPAPNSASTTSPSTPSPPASSAPT